MLKQRIISAVVLVAFIIMALFYFSPIYFALSLGVVVSLAVWEWTQFAQVKTTFWRGFIACIFGCFIFLWIYSYSDELSLGEVFSGYAQPILFVAVIWWIFALGLVATFPKSKVIWEKANFLQVFFAFCALVPFFVAVLKLRLDNYLFSPTHGITLLLYVFILVWAADSGAYFAGRAFGKHKLAPLVSPGKTWEGVLGGLVSACVLALIFVNFIGQDSFRIPTISFILLSIGTVAISVLGDLVESMFKRVANIKDSSQLIPGHGGVLDRIDSLLSAVPFFSFFYFYWL